jgi:CheY-like chemotaxis protein
MWNWIERSEEDYNRVWVETGSRNYGSDCASVHVPGNAVRKVAIIDDDVLQSVHYAVAIRAKGYECSHFKSPASLLTAIKKGQRFECFVVDLMMSPRGAYTHSATDGGEITGLVLAKDLRTTFSLTPIIIFSNANADGLISKVKKELQGVHNVIFVAKSSFKPNKLADSICGLLETGKPIEERRGLLLSMWSSLLLQPSLFGIGIDLKKLLPKAWRGEEATG